MDFEVISKKCNSEVSKFLHVIYTIQTLTTLPEEGFSGTIIIYNIKTIVNQKIITIQWFI